MKSLYLRIWLTVVLALALFAGVSSWLWQRHVEQERERIEARVEATAIDRIAAWAELVQRSLPPADASPADQAQALRDWSFRLRLPMALDDRNGQRLGASESFLRRELDGGTSATSVKLDDGRTLWVARRGMRRGPLGVAGSPGPGMVPRDGGPMNPDMPGRSAPPWWPALPFGLPPALGPALLLGLLFVAVAAGAYPVVRRLTSRLEALKQGVETFGSGVLDQRVDESGRDEVAALAVTFNQAARRIESLVRSHQTLLANASHELRSPLARLKMAVALFADAKDSHREELKREIDANVAELNELVEEVLLASRLDSTQGIDDEDRVDLLGVAAEEAARVGAELSGRNVIVRANERLLRRAMRNLLENGRRYGKGELEIRVNDRVDGAVGWQVCDRGQGVPEAYRERIFEPFFRLPGHAEREGGVGLGLSLVRQIAERHGGQVRCEPRTGGGSCFVVSLADDRRC